MRNYRITDKYGQTAVVLGHTAAHAAERCYKMYLMRAVKVELIAQLTAPAAGRKGGK
jgi:hypothetical protein